MIASLSRSLGRVRPYLSLRPFDVSTADGRAGERQRRVVLSALVAMFAKIVSVGTQLITIPMTLNYLGAERFGLWMTISSVIAMLAFADLGIGNGLLNAIAEANGKDDLEAIRRYISSAALILTLISCLVLGGLALSYPFIPWAGFFNVHTPLAIAEAGPAAAAFVVCFAVNIPATIVQRVQLGLQMGFVANIWQAVGSLIGLLAVVSVVHLRMGLHLLVIAFAGAPVIAAILNGVVFFSRVRPDLRPRISLATREGAFKVVRIGVLFLALQIVVAVTYTSDNFVIARVLGASAVTTYAVPDKMYSVIPLLLTMMLTPLWPAYGEAIARHDGAWVRQVLRKTLLISLATASVLAFVFFVFGGQLLSLWAGHVIAPPMALMLGLSVWKVIEAIGTTIAVYLNGHNLIQQQLVVSGLTALFAIVAKFYLVENYGVAGAIWATIFSYLIFSAAPLLFLTNKSLKNLATAGA